MKATNKLVEEEELAERIDMFLFFLKHFLWVFKCKKIISIVIIVVIVTKRHKQGFT